MSTATAITPPTAASSFTKNSYETQPQPTLNQLPNLHIDDKSTSLSDISSPEPRTLDLRSPILEEEEDDISSEAANEPVTPTYNYHSHTLPDRMIGATKPGQDSVHTLATASASETPTILSTSPTPSLLRRPTTKSEATKQVPKTPTPKRPGLSSKDSHIKRGLSGFFRRSNSHGASDHHVIPFHMVDGVNESDPTLRQKQPKATRRMSANNSPYTTQSNTPPSPRSPVLDGADDRPTQPQLSVQEPSKDELNTSRRKTRSSTGFGIRGKLHLHKPKTPLHSEARAPTNPQTRHRATSVDLENVVPDHSITGTRSPDAKLPERSIWALPAETGIGLKSRRLSLSLPDDFFVDVAELYTEFQDQSKLVGKRGKSIGKGATSKVKLMTRKGYPNEVYAVKEFRGKSSTEKHEEYEKKVKSEFSIAKSVHHPNIVETIRLCTYDGRWNHVMEYCDQGDLFTLVSQKYLSRPDRLNDRLCFFKQIAQGIHYLHSNGIAHRDIKLENLLVTRDSKLKITDFGVSEVFAGTHPGLRSAGGECGKDMGEIRLCAPGMCGSPPYVAPEVLEKNGEYDPRPLDVWGAAVVMLTICANGCLWTQAKMGASPAQPLYEDLVNGWAKWEAKHADDPKATISETDYPHVGFFDQHINPPALRRALLTMLNPNPTKRASIATIAKNRWLKNIECCQIDSYDDPSVIIDATKIKSCPKNITKVVAHNHLPPHHNFGHKFVRLPGSTDM